MPLVFGKIFETETDAVIDSINDDVINPTVDQMRDNMETHPESYQEKRLEEPPINIKWDINEWAEPSKEPTKLYVSAQEPKYAPNSEEAVFLRNLGDPRPITTQVVDGAKNFLTGMSNIRMTDIVKGIGESIYSGFTLPGDVAKGRVSSEDTIRRAADLAGLMVFGPAPIASKIADGTVGSFAGVRSKGLDSGKLTQAQHMDRAGKSPDEIWEKTGMFKGVDNAWKYEIDDSAMKVLPVFPDKFEKGVKKGIELQELIDHPELFKAYPELKKFKIKFEEDADRGFDYGGLAYPDHILLPRGTVFSEDPNYLKRVIVHEVQHIIQNKEGFAKGGPWAEKFALRYEKEVDSLRNEAQEILDNPKNWEKTPEGWDAIKDEFSDRLEYIEKVINTDLKRRDAAPDEAKENYRKFAGETESRNVEKRLINQKQFLDYERASDLFKKQGLALDMTYGIERKGYGDRQVGWHRKPKLTVRKRFTKDQVDYEDLPYNLQKVIDSMLEGISPKDVSPMRTMDVPANQQFVTNRPTYATPYGYSDNPMVVPE